MAHMNIKGEAFNVEVAGRENAPALMLSNSLGTDLHMWDAQMPALTARFRVVRYDSRGAGASVTSEGPYSIAQLAGDALAILDALGIDKTHWMGVSKGGMVGQWLLTHAPHRIMRAVLANTAAHLPSADLWNARIRAVNTQNMHAVTPAVLDRWFTKAFQRAAPEAVAAVKRMLHHTPAAGYAACCAAIRDMDQREAIRAVTAPVLVINGRLDPATPPAMGELIAKRIKGATLVSLEAAHLSNIEQPKAFTKAALAFLTAKDKVVVKGKTAKKASKTAAAKAPAKKAAPPKSVKTKAVKTSAKKTIVKKAAKTVPAKTIAAKTIAAKAPAPRATPVRVLKIVVKKKAKTK